MSISNENLDNYVLANLPECSFSVTCTGWKYDAGLFNFRDPETGEKLTLDRAKARKGLALYRKLRASQGQTLVYENFDGEDVDCIVQMALFGSIVYG